MRNIGILATNDRNNGQRIYLNNPQVVPWDGVTSLPWLLPTTSPFQLSVNARGQPYTPLASPPPDARSRWYDLPPVTETLTIQAPATTADAAVQLIQLLQRVLMGRGRTHPPLFFQEDGAGQRRYAAILDAKVQEAASFFSMEYRSGLATVQVQITRTPFFAAGSLTTLFSGSVGNRPSGLPTNRVLWSGLPDGALTEIGLPLTLTIVPTAGDSLRSSFTGVRWVRIYAATVRSASQKALGTSINNSGYMAWTDRSYTLALPTSEYTRLRFLAKVTGAANAGKARAIVYLGTGGDGALYTSPWIASGGTCLLDFGGYQPPVSFTSGSASEVYTVEIEFDTAGGTLNRIEVLEYLTYGWLDAYRSTNIVVDTYVIASARTQTIESTPAPLVHARPHTTTSNVGTLVGTGIWRGEPPVATADGLWLAWGESTTGGGNELAVGPPEPYRLTIRDTETVTLTAQTLALHPTFWPQGAP